MKSYRILSLTLLILILSACSSPLLSADVLPWVSDEPILFKDDFQLQQGGWTTRDDLFSFSGYDHGSFRLRTTMPNYQIWSVPGLQFSNTQVYVRAEKLNGPDDNLLGLICRYQNESNFYAFVISSDGYYGIYKRAGENLALIDQDHLDFSEVIVQGEGVNRLSALCYEDQLSLIVNDTLLLQVEDSSFVYGDVGMIVGNFEQGGVDILFDQFIVVKR